LETNYRSTREILDGANAVIRNNPARHDKTLRSAAGPGHRIGVFKLPDEEQEALFVVEQLLGRVREEKVPLHEVAILFRTVLQARVFEMQLRQNRVPYNLVGGMSFFDRKEVRDVLAYLKLLVNPADEISLLRVINVPARGIGLKTVETALSIAAEQRVSLSEIFSRGTSFPNLQPAAVKSANGFLAMLDDLRHTTRSTPPVEVVRQVVRTVDYPAELRRCYPDEEAQNMRWAAISEIMNMAEVHTRRTRGASLTTFLEELTLNAAEDNEEVENDREEAVTLMTLHAAKGLEFDHVYLVGVEEGLLPHTKSIVDRDVEEERRLTYVGMTRARRRLTMTYTESRARYGERVAIIPSRFLYEMRGKEVPAEHLESVLQHVHSSANEQKKPAPKRGHTTRKRKGSVRKKRQVDKTA
jgi:DNA helicase-2/ATP-dependent DNA helicase PcrA